MTVNRWDWLESLQPETAIAVSVKYLARTIADELSDWPPRVAMSDDPSAQRFADLLGPGAARPTLAAFQEAIKRVTWELTRDFDAIDFYERNHHLENACPDPRDRLGSELIQHYVLESFFTLMERTENRVKRKDVLVGVSQLTTHIEARWNAS